MREKPNLLPAYETHDDELPRRARARFWHTPTLSDVASWTLDLLALALVWDALQSLMQGGSFADFLQSLIAPGICLLASLVLYIIDVIKYKTFLR